jgi:hypothetical protein
VIEHVGSKLLVAPAAVFVVADVLPKIVESGAKGIALSAAALGGLGYLAKLTHRGHKKIRAFFHRVGEGLDIIESTPQHFKDVEERLDHHSEALEEHRKLFDVVADSDRSRIKDALAGDPRSPVDRRAA